MELRDITYMGEGMDDPEVLSDCPPDLQELLRQANGWIAWSGGFHLRGAVQAPHWHSLRHAWWGDSALYLRWDALTADDVPFAEDFLGDQFVLRGDKVWHLAAETNTLTATDQKLAEFLDNAAQNPMEFLGLHHLHHYIEQGHRLVPGYLLNAFPPFCTKESGEGLSLRAVPTNDRMDFLSDFSAQLKDVPEGGQVTFVDAPEGEDQGPKGQ